MNEDIPASPEMQKFFTRLLEVKQRLQLLSDELTNVYMELNEIIKEKK